MDGHLENNSHLKMFQPLKIANGKIELKHRAIYAPMTRMRGLPMPNEPAHKGFTRNWCLDDLFADYYGQRANEGGLLISEGIAPSQQGLGLPGVPGLYKPEQISVWKKVTEAVHAKGGYIYAQLWHCGRVIVPQYSGLPSVSSSSDTWGSDDMFPCPNPEDGSMIPIKDHPPQKLDDEGIKRVLCEYVDCAKAAVNECGFDGIEVHGANGYLPEQFLASNINTRTDAYGGSPEKRPKFVLDLLAALGAAIGIENVAIRLSPFGLCHQMRSEQRLETWLALCRGIKERTDIGTLSYVHFIEPRFEQLHTLEEKAQWLAAFGEEPSLTPFRVILKGIPFVAAGGYNASNCFDEIENGHADAIAFGRLFLANPDFVDRLKEGKRFNAYNRATFYASTLPRELGYTDYPTYEEALEKEGMRWYGDKVVDNSPRADAGESEVRNCRVFDGSDLRFQKGFIERVFKLRQLRIIDLI